MAMKILLLLVLSVWIVLGQDGCTFFKKKYDQARGLDALRRSRDKVLEDSNILQEADDLGYGRTTLTPCRFSNVSRWYDTINAELIMTAARLVSDINPADLDTFENNMICYKDPPLPLKTRSKYRNVNGMGNNLQNPYWGTTGSPFGRFGPKNYADKIHTTRKSASGGELPGARTLVQHVLTKAEKFPRTSKIPNDMANFFALFVTHDFGHQVNTNPPTKKCDDMRCCTKQNKDVLQRSLQNSACMPIGVSVEDSFYKDHNITCLNFIRSERSSIPTKFQFGEIKNKATGYLDLSLIYGNEEVDTRDVRTFSKGKLNVGVKNLLPTDKEGNYTKIVDRMHAVPYTAILPALFTRQHNKMADELARLNPLWSDEKVFQETRRVNIALLQSMTYNGADFLFESKNGLKINEKYDATMDVSSNLEFHSGAYRYFHFYVNTEVMLVDRKNKVTGFSLSDIFGDLELVEDKFDSVVRGLLLQTMNFGEFSEEMTNRFAKNDEGLGIDVVSFDVQRGRDHGLPTYLQTRATCGLKSDFKTFDDLIEIFPQSYIDLLKPEYESVEDIDLIVGGSLESFLSVETSLVGETFDCIIRDQFKRTMAGDAYFYTNPNNSYPFTTAQIQAVNDFSFNNLICLNSGLASVPSSIFYIENDINNARINCTSYKPMNLQAWKNV